MEIWEEESIPLIGGSTVTVRLVNVLEFNGPPHTELWTRFSYPLTDGESVQWGSSYPLCDYLSTDYMEQEFRQEVARWERFRSHG